MRKRRRLRLQPRVPPTLAWTARRGDDSDAATIHCACARASARRGLGERLAIPAQLGWWALSNLALVSWTTAREGPAVRRRSGKGLLRQAREQIGIAARHSIAPPRYYVFELHDEHRRRKAGLYLHRFETKGAHGVYKLLRAPLGLHAPGLGDKLSFARRCRAHDLPVVPVLAVAEDGRLRPVETGAAELPATDLFVKPVRSKGGRGAERWVHEGDRRFRSHRGPLRTAPELVRDLERRSRAGALLVQPRIHNHPALADLGGGVLATLRVVTVLDEERAPEVTHAVLRMALAADAVVDNFHAGGIAAPVDLQTDRLGPALGLRGANAASGGAPHDRHPRTGAPIRGRSLPHLRAALALARRAHAALPCSPVVGWDLALAAEGPLLVEGNSAPDLDILQRCARAPLGDTRIAELMAHHLRRSLSPPTGAPRLPWAAQRGLEGQPPGTPS